MVADYTFTFTTANPPATNVIINEVDSDTPGTDTAEFVKLYDGGVGNTPLDGLVVVFYNGGNNASYAAFDLDGYSTNANGYFTLGNPGVPNVDLTFNPGASGLLQNGPDAVALYAGDATDSRIAAPSPPRISWTRLFMAPTIPTQRAFSVCLTLRSLRSMKMAVEAHDSIEPALPQWLRRCAQHINLFSGHAYSRRGKQLSASASAKQQHYRSQPDLRRRR